MTGGLLPRKDLYQIETKVRVKVRGLAPATLARQRQRTRGFWIVATHGAALTHETRGGDARDAAFDMPRGNNSGMIRLPSQVGQGDWRCISCTTVNFVTWTSCRREECKGGGGERGLARE